MKNLLYSILFLCLFSCEKEIVNTKLSGSVFGTTYNIQYYSDNDLELQKDIDSIFFAINQSMSTYIPNSNISKINNNEKVKVDAHFF